MKQLLPQRCPVAFLYFNWLFYVAVIVYFGVAGDFLASTVWLLGFPLVYWGYVSMFPHISSFLGYGRVSDEAADRIDSKPVQVTIYTALGCPFCPTVAKRLNALRKQMGFDLEEVDVTFKPDLLVRKGIRSVPVVEVEGRRITGHATSRVLAAFIAGS